MQVLKLNVSKAVVKHIQVSKHFHTTQMKILRISAFGDLRHPRSNSEHDKNNFTLPFFHLNYFTILIINITSIAVFLKKKLISKIGDN